MRESARILGELLKPKRILDFGVITAVDLQKYRARVQVTSGIVTGWLRILSGYTGDGYGFVAPPAVGDEVLVAFLDGDPLGQGIILGRLYGSDRPPEVKVKEIVLKHVSGTTVRLLESGKVEIETTDEVSIQVHGNVDLAVDGNLVADVQGTADIKAQKVNLGKNAAGGVLTDVTLPACLFTGAPMRSFSSKTVKGQS